MSLVSGSSYEARAIDTPCEIDIKEFIQRIIRLISGQIMARRTIISRQGFKCETTPVASWIFLIQDAVGEKLQKPKRKR